MQFKLITLLTLTVASVNGALHHKRSDKLAVRPLSIGPSGSNTGLLGTCTCAGHTYTGVNTQDAINQAGSGLYLGYVTYYATFDVLSCPPFQLPSSVPKL